jgi:hypothetical protein
MLMTVLVDFQIPFRLVVVLYFQSLRVLSFSFKSGDNLENDSDLSVWTVSRTRRQLKATNHDREREIEFTASHFAEMSSSNIVLIGSDICLLSAIVSDGSLIIKNENWLVCLIIGLSRVQSAYSSLFGDVLFEYGSGSVIGDFIELN